MLIAVISDIHSNLEALSVVLADMEARRADMLVCLGDIVGYGPDPSSCLSLLRERATAVVMGNHEEAVFNPRERDNFTERAYRAIEWTAGRLTAGEIEWMKGLPYQLEMEGIRFAHATPKASRSWDYVFSAFEARVQAGAFSERLCFIGHSHVAAVHPLAPSVREYNVVDRFIINPGSVGQPRDGDPRSSYGLLDTVAGSYENVRLEYDLEATIRKIREAGLPRSLGDRLRIGK